MDYSRGFAKTKLSAASRQRFGLEQISKWGKKACASGSPAFLKVFDERRY